MNRTKIVYFVLIASSILLVINIYEIGLEGLKTKSVIRPISNILIIFAMIFTLIDNNSKLD